MEYDNLINDAAQIVVEYQQASPSILQRKLKLGYNQASQIVNQLEELKIIGPSNGAKTRVILFSDSNELDTYLNSI